MDELRRMLAIECTRADASFFQSQLAARAALAQELISGAERIAAVPLQIERMEFEFQLVAVRPSWWRRVQTRLLEWRGQPLPAPAARFRFAAGGEAGVNVSFALQRQGRRLQAEAAAG